MLALWFLACASFVLTCLLCQQIISYQLHIFDLSALSALPHSYPSSGLNWLISVFLCVLEHVSAHHPAHPAGYQHTHIQAYFKPKNNSGTRFA
jgi:hypothetical protein